MNTTVTHGHNRDLSWECGCVEHNRRPLPNSLIIRKIRILISIFTSKWSYFGAKNLRRLKAILFLGFWSTENTFPNSPKKLLRWNVIADSGSCIAVKRFTYSKQRNVMDTIYTPKISKIYVQYTYIWKSLHRTISGMGVRISVKMQDFAHHTHTLNNWNKLLWIEW